MVGQPGTPLASLEYFVTNPLVLRVPICQNSFFQVEKKVSLMVGQPGLEPGTNSLKGYCSTN